MVFQLSVVSCQLSARKIRSKTLGIRDFPVAEKAKNVQAQSACTFLLTTAN